MEQEITSEKIKKLELKKSMLNFKILSLMKKQLFYLVLVLALIAGSIKSGYAQIGATAAENDATHRYIMVTGSQHTFTVARSNDANTIAWSVWTDVATPVDVTANTTNVESSSGANTEDFQLRWARSAFGNYYIQAVETDADNAAGCATTTRRFFVTIIDFDIYVYASTSTGAEISGALLDACGNGTTARYGDIGSGAAFSNVFDGGGTPGDLIPFEGAISPQTLRYISFQIMWHVQNAAETTVPTVGSFVLDFDADLIAGAGTYTANSDIVSINTQTTSLDAATNFVVPSAPGTPGPIATAGNVIAGEIGIFTFVINDRWNHSTTMYDLLLDMMLTNVELRLNNDGTGTIIGTEPVAYENPDPSDQTVTDASNNSAVQTIRLAPATSTISVTQN